MGISKVEREEREYRHVASIYLLQSDKHVNFLLRTLKLRESDPFEMPTLQDVIDDVLEHWSDRPSPRELKEPLRERFRNDRDLTIWQDDRLLAVIRPGQGEKPEVIVFDYEMITEGKKKKKPMPPKKSRPKSD